MLRGHGAPRRVRRRPGRRWKRSSARRLGRALPARRAPAGVGFSRPIISPITKTPTWPGGCGWPATALLAHRARVRHRHSHTAGPGRAGQGHLLQRQPAADRGAQLARAARSCATFTALPPRTSPPSPSPPRGPAVLRPSGARRFLARAARRTSAPGAAASRARRRRRLARPRLAAAEAGHDRPPLAGPHPRAGRRRLRSAGSSLLPVPFTRDQGITPTSPGEHGWRGAPPYLGLVRPQGPVALSRLHAPALKLPGGAMGPNPRPLGARTAAVARCLAAAGRRLAAPRAAFYARGPHRAAAARGIQLLLVERPGRDLHAPADRAPTWLALDPRRRPACAGRRRPGCRADRRAQAHRPAARDLPALLDRASRRLRGRGGAGVLTLASGVWRPGSAGWIVYFASGRRRVGAMWETVVVSSMPATARPAWRSSRSGPDLPGRHRHRLRRHARSSSRCACCAAPTGEPRAFAALFLLASFLQVALQGASSSITG
ncbi:MAG: hypothetical protein MZV64_34770 [Ignavibacteriales bacterium]|nr:hypothetical protein [Ignavibacteriales bacterium]